MARHISVHREAITIFFSTGLLYGLHHPVVLPGVDKRSVDGFIIRKHILQALNDVPAALFGYCRKDYRNSEDLGNLRESDDIVDDDRRVVTVQVGELESLMIDQQQYALFRGKKGVQACLCHIHIAFSLS